jgi:ectoine hydroxylase-related dioxygenase (phytanoyl-CoA dioxygenase family)
MLTKTDVADYRRQGFVPGRRHFSAGAAAALREDCIRTCAVEIKNTPRRQANNRLKPYLLYRWAAELVRHPAILDSIEALIGPDILVFHTTVWFKAPQSAKSVPWHQDATYFGLEPFEHVTAWVALTPSTEAMGCVEMLPRSNRHGQLAHRDDPDPNLMVSRGQTVAIDVDDSAAVSLIMAPGDVSFHHTLAVHRSGPNTSAAPRIGIGISYIPTHVRHVGETRLSATLARGDDRFFHYDPEPAPDGDATAAATAAHREALDRYRRASESLPEMTGIH